MSILEGKTAIVTGAASGIGYAIASALGKHGMKVVVADLSQEAAEEACSELRKTDVNCMALTLDVTDEAQWQTAVTEVKQKYQKIHMLVNNAGVGTSPCSIEDDHIKNWKWAFNVNVFGIFCGTQAVVPTIKSQKEGGWIINVASMAGMGGVIYGGAYTASKNAVVAMSESWAQELMPQGIGVSVLCPAFVKTQISRAERNKPEEFKTDSTMSEQQIAQAKLLMKAVDEGIEPEIVGERVIEAITNREFYIFTHPAFREDIAGRGKAIDKAFSVAEKSPVVGHLKDLKPNGFAI
ncbi:SDR family NAD(P)-dependent oxidoreductase [Marinibactrum halimedae]|uniref:Short-chain dehydrogenase n=1 Tax=Marinibactrum halimedae TaxID=1444977 RepID=A0AA37T0V7_9GAMM|nr:SDR family NAD(P)-dependent oxidoreductase [Marinibactrum halimedae]MCD9457771.1 SDR family NAD(P)-dependent oxidoreductase [Marinibactrum halimedae]GLS24855.1 short-chain dehydrogenase [Marinibactrum halimedae]